MRALLSTYWSQGPHESHESHGDVEPMVEMTVQLRALGVEMPVCAPPDFAGLLARVGVPLPLAPVGQPVRPLVAGATPPPLAAEGRDAQVTTGVMPSGVWR